MPEQQDNNAAAAEQTPQAAAEVQTTAAAPATAETAATESPQPEPAAAEEPAASGTQADQAATDRIAIGMLGLPMVYRTAHRRLAPRGIEHHAAVITAVVDRSHVNLKVLPDGVASFDLERVPVVDKHPADLEPGECAPARH